MRPRFKTKAGRLTPYAFACGYLERRPLASGADVTLWGEHGCYHVRAHGPDGRIFWDSFHTLTEARKRYANA
jgi:hypothetical protein